MVDHSLRHITKNATRIPEIRGLSELPPGYRIPTLPPPGSDRTLESWIRRRVTATANTERRTIRRTIRFGQGTVMSTDIRSPSQSLLLDQF